jgi:hypothetical protein
MRAPSILAASVILIACAIAAFAQAQNAPAFEKKNYTYSEWTKGRFSEAVTVTGPGKTIFLAGVGAEDENGAAGTILHPGDFMGQCNASVAGTPAYGEREHSAYVASLITPHRKVL